MFPGRRSIWGASCAEDLVGLGCGSGVDWVAGVKRGEAGAVWSRDAMVEGVG